MTSQFTTAKTLADSNNEAAFVLASHDNQIADFFAPANDAPANDGGTHHRKPQNFHQLPAVQQELFELDPNNHAARYRHLAQLPPKVAQFFAKQYKRRLQAYGNQYAIEWFQTKMREMLPRFKLVMGQYADVLSLLDTKPKGNLKWLDEVHYDVADFTPQPNETENQKAERIARKIAHCSKVLSPIVERLDRTAKEINAQRLQPLCYLRDDQIKQLADTIAYHINERLGEFMEAHAAEFEDSSQTYKLFTALYKEFVALCDQFRIPAPYADESKRGRLTHSKLERGLLKLSEFKYWYNKLKRTADRMKEHLAIAMGMVSTMSGGYVSNYRLNEYKKQKQANLEYLKSCLLVNLANEEEQQELFDIWLKSSANPQKRRIDLMTRLRGYEDIAERDGYVGVFATLTAPSKYHAMSGDQPNQKWNGSSPPQTQGYLCGIWAKMRSKLKRQKIPIFGFRIAEPHADATPHWHILIWCKPEQKREMKRIIWQYAMAEDGKEKGAWKHRCTFKDIDPAKGSAVGYIAKYISKNIDGCHLGDLKDDETGEDIRLAAERVQAWASLWSIRQFQQIGGAPVGVYREIRKLGDAKQEDKLVEQFRLGCDLGDYAYYTDLQGGPMVLRKELKLRLNYIEKGETKYGEIRKVVNGVMNMLDGNVTITKTKEWQIVRKTAENKAEIDRTYRIEDADRLIAEAEKKTKSDKPTQGEALKKGDLSPPWTCVTNCTGSKNEQISKEDRERIKNELILMKGRVTDYQIDDLLSGKPLKIYSNERVKVYVEYIDGQLVEKKRYEKLI